MHRYIFFIIQEEAIKASVPTGRVKQFRCAFFNFTGAPNGTGSWSSKGLTSAVFNGTHVQCNASHLTSFVVLVSIVPSEDLVSALLCIQHNMLCKIIMHRCSVLYTLIYGFVCYYLW